MIESGYSPSSAFASRGPMTFGQVLDRTYRLMRDNLRLFSSIAAVPSVAFLAVLAPVIGFALIAIGPRLHGNAAAIHTFPPYPVAMLMAIGYLVIPLVGALYMPAASYAATQADRGIQVSFGQAYGVAWRRFGRYLWLMILCGLIVVVPIAVVAALIASGAVLMSHAAGSGLAGVPFVLIPLMLLLYLAAAVYSVLIMLRFALAYPASVVEGLPAWTALQRSALLTRGAKGRIFLVMLVVYAVTYVVGLVCVCVFIVLGALGAFVAVLAHVTQQSPAFYILIGLAALAYLATIVAQMLFSYAAYTTALAVLYHDQRLRKDGPVPPLPAGEAV